MKSTSISNTLRHGKVFLGSDFILHPQFESFMSEHAGTLNQNPLLLLDTVYKELENMSATNPQVKIIFKQRQLLLKRYIDSQLIKKSIDNAKQTTVVSQAFARIIQQYHPQQNVCLLTNDSKCLKEANRILAQQSIVHYHRITVWGFQNNSSDEVVCLNSDKQPTKQTTKMDKTTQTNQTPTACNHKNNVRAHADKGKCAKMFNTNSTITPEAINPTLLHVQTSLSKGSVVYRLVNNQFQPVYLTDVINAGGEGTVYKTNISSTVCKIYHKEKTTNFAQHKIELMVTRKIADPCICWPTDVIYDQSGTFRGYLMPEAKGQTLASTVFKPLWLQKQRNWTRRESVNLVLNILDKIKYLHKAGILMGDINEKNILIENCSTVYFVDCDSYQVEGFPCCVGVSAYVPPELQGVNFQRQLRTKQNELFAVAILLFMIMVPGKHPYSHQDGEDCASNIKKGHFPYPLGENHSDRVPNGKWRYCWSHLTYHIKEAFYNCFREAGNGTHRPSIAQWIAEFKFYQTILNNPNNTYTGPRQNYGFDLQPIPENRRRVRELAEQGDEANSLLPNGKTDWQWQQECIMRELPNISIPQSTPSYTGNTNTTANAGGNGYSRPIQSRPTPYQPVCRQPVQSQPAYRQPVQRQPTQTGNYPRNNGPFSRQTPTSTQSQPQASNPIETIINFFGKLFK